MRMAGCSVKGVSPAGEDGSVLTVYLDQNKWVDLARAETGHPDGEPFVETMAILKKAVDDGRARFPLSAAHYYETSNRRDRRKRVELATTMARLAGTLRIAPPHTIVTWEIQRALVEVFDLPLALPELRLFGNGVAHAFSAPTLRYSAPTEWHGVALPSKWQEELQRRSRTGLRGDDPGLDNYTEHAGRGGNETVTSHPSLEVDLRSASRRGEVVRGGRAQVSDRPAGRGQNRGHCSDRCSAAGGVAHRPRTRPGRGSTRAYAERRRAEGQTDREVKRCLERYIARELYRRLGSPPSALDAA
jgi:hypothetical protein